MYTSGYQAGLTSAVLAAVPKEGNETVTDCHAFKMTAADVPAFPLAVAVFRGTALAHCCEAASAAFAPRWRRVDRGF
jgi:hypothetical protein